MVVTAIPRSATKQLKRASQPASHGRDRTLCHHVTPLIEHPSGFPMSPSDVLGWWSVAIDLLHRPDLVQMVLLSRSFYEQSEICDASV